VLRVLKPGGRLELRTDSENYYRYALEVFSRPREISFCVKKNRSLPVISKYEARWRRREKDIFALTLYSNVFSPQRSEGCDFVFEKRLSGKRPGELPAKSIVEEDYFVHFGHTYLRTDNGGGIIECSFGSFERPEHKYIFFEADGRMFYFPDIPVRTKANCKAHNRMRGFLYGC